MTDNEDLTYEIQETEGEVLAKEAAMDSPFDGYGRPFSDDPLGMSDAYNHDNPANNVGPYSGPNSYSINTVAPYAPPHQDEENPAQNVGPYRPPATMPETTDGDFDEDDLPANVGKGDTDNDLRHAYKAWTEKQWFDGTSSSIYDRAIEAEHLRRTARMAGDFVIEDELQEQIEVLNKTAAEYDDSVLHEALENVPGGTVALEYDDLVDGGLVDVTSFLSVGAHKIAKEAADYDWDAFKNDGARHWVFSKIADNPGLIKHESMCREAAVDYAKDKTMVLMDPLRRADIIDEFVTAAERFRRQAANRLLEDERTASQRQHQIEAARMQRVADDVSNSLQEGFLPGAYTDLGSDYDEEGYYDIGEDDGSVLYQVARETIESSKRPWEVFTTEGAREWFFSKVIDSPMVKHDDITYRAAKKYASEQAAGVPDVSLRSEIVRAFTESVEFLREAHLQREASRVEEEPESDLEDFFGGDSLWL